MRASNFTISLQHAIFALIGPIPWGHSGPLCHVVNIDARVRQWRHLVNGRAVARSGEWAQHFSNASCLIYERQNVTFGQMLLPYEAQPASAAGGQAFIAEQWLRHV